MREYLVVLEHEGSAWGAYVPDLPGCVAAGESREDVERLIREAIAFHIEGMRVDGEPVPEPSSAAILIKVA
ncbi:MAG TPA: type II toxin-antitoxin system HicB family antitoxin [Acidimicrobiales bacterium]|nr:type II toxin-antitoxin system HicB family antitoxin [Acidimicrobiales bacterium]HUB69209.1 type II toxin-antitoxin system HicB family antitoxin [Acidimicrobiales bacterium]